MTSRRAAVDVAVLTLAIAAATWPWAASFGSATFAASEPSTLTHFHLFLQEWTTQVIRRGGSWWDPPFFAPFSGVMAWSEPQPLAGALAAALTTVVSSVVAYNLILYAWLLGMGLAGRWVAAQAGAGRAEALLAGAWLAAGPYTLQQGGAPHLVALGFPFAALGCVFAWMREPTLRWAWLAAIAVIATGLSGAKNLLFLALVLPVALLGWLVLDGRGVRERVRAAGPLRLAAHAAAAVAAAATVLAPLAMSQLERLTAAGMAHPMAEVEGYVHPAELITPADGHWLASRWLHLSYAEGHYCWDVGIVWLVVLLAGGLVLRRLPAPGPGRGLAGALLGLGAFALLVAFGPSAKVELGGLTLSPYVWMYRWVPGFSGVRSPAHILGFVNLAVAAGAAAALTALRARAGARAWPLVIVALFAAAETFAGPARVAAPAAETPDTEAVLDWLIHAAPPGTLLDLPFSGGPNPADYAGEVVAMRRALGHGHPVANGYSGFFPTPYLQLQAALLADAPGRGLRYLEALGVRLVWMHHARADRGGGRLLTETYGAPAFRAGDEVVWVLPERAATHLALPDHAKLRAAPPADAWIGLHLDAPVAAATLLVLPEPRDLPVTVDAPGGPWTTSLRVSGATLLDAGADRVALRVGEPPAPGHPGTATLAALEAFPTAAPGKAP